MLFKLIQSPLIHVCGLATYLIFFLYTVNIDQVEITETIIPSVLSLFLVLVLLTVLNLGLKNLKKSALIVSALTLHFYYYKVLCNLLNAIFSTELGNTIPVTLWVISLIMSIFVIHREKKNVDEANNFLNVVTVVLFAMLIFNASSSRANERAIIIPEIDAFVEKAQSLVKPAVLPDIYYIILDSYARNDVLSQLYKFDNGSFTAFLEEKGFFVASESYANYCQTNLSLASSLNGCYLDDLTKIMAGSNSLDAPARLVKEAAVFNILRFYGYELIAFPTYCNVTEVKTADRYLSKRMTGNTFAYMLAHATILHALNLPFLSLTEIEVESFRQHIERIFTGISTVKLTKKPAFVFAHIICPHPPFVFGPNGERKISGPVYMNNEGHLGIDADKYREYYIEQLMCVNLKTTSMVKDLLAEKNRARVVIIQSDHGPDSELDWENYEKTNKKERLAILNAVYYSESSIKGLNKHSSPVNTFRAVLNEVFNANLDLLENRTYFSLWSDRYRFIDATEVVSEKPLEEKL